MNKAIWIGCFGLMILTGAGWAAGRPGAERAGMPAENVLDTAAFSLDRRMMDVLAVLELIAMTPEARAGDWPGIKPYLAHLKKRVPGIYFHVLPDGNYFSVAKDFTNLNLSDRDYFQPLFAGNQIKGAPIYGRISGRKSAVMACPILRDGKVTGALGASVYLDDLHASLNDEMGLPQHATWFVVDAAGLTMLDKDADFIFMNALTQGSESLAAAMRAVLQSDRGRVQYELGGRQRHACYRKLPNMDWWMILAELDDGIVSPPPKLEISLDRFVPELQAALDKVDASLSRKSGLTEESEIRGVLAGVIAGEPMVATASYIDSKGILRYIEPREYKNVEGSDISGQTHVIEMMKSRRPVLSDGFMAVEGFPAVVIAQPVTGAADDFMGSINLVVRPELIVRRLLKNMDIPPEYELWIMQTDGMIVYDQDRHEIGRMLFSDPLYAGYKTLLRLGEKIVAEPSGIGEYVFEAAGSNENVLKTAAWDTVKLHGRAWRVVLCFPTARK